jgi:hypothetical protein
LGRGTVGKPPSGCESRDGYQAPPGRSSWARVGVDEVCRAHPGVHEHPDHLTDSGPDAAVDIGDDVAVDVGGPVTATEVEYRDIRR